MLLLYNAALYPVRAAVHVWGAWKTRGASPSREWAERTARSVPEVAPGGIWIHGASVGEARLVRALAREIRRRWPAAVLSASCVTRTGRGQLPGAPEVEAAFFLPLDLPGFPGRVLDSVAPSVLVLVETELWPNLLHEASHRGVPVVLVNGRLAPERMARYRRLSRLYAPLVSSLAGIGAQSGEERDRFLELGAREANIVVTGNLKYDLPIPAGSAELLRSRFGLAAGRPVVVAGSTGEGEDALVLDAFLDARRAAPDLFLVLAPRHPERFAAAAGEIAKRGLSFRRTADGDAPAADSPSVLLVDTMGELASLYLLATVAFVGGSLVPVGGHNLVEPAVAGAPVLFGPHVGHVAEMAEMLLVAGAARRVSDGPELGRAVVEIVLDAGLRRRMTEGAARVIAANRGALARSADLVLACSRPHSGAA